jgi:hypothetical protein
LRWRYQAVHRRRGSSGRDASQVRVGLANSAKPSVLAVIASATAEVKGDDIDAVIRDLDHDLAPAVIAIHAPDYQGGLEEGYLAAVRALVALAEEDTTGERARHAASRAEEPPRVTVLAGAHLTPADARELRDTVEAFGLTPVLVPDLGALDGSRERFSAVASGGTTLAELRSIGERPHARALGVAGPAARDLAARFGTPYTVLDDVWARRHRPAARHAHAAVGAGRSASPSRIASARRRDARRARPHRRAPDRARARARRCARYRGALRRDGGSPNARDRADAPHHARRIQADSVTVSDRQRARRPRPAGRQFARAPDGRSSRRAAAGMRLPRFEAFGLLGS